MSEMTRRDFGAMAAMFGAFTGGADGTLGRSKVFAPELKKMPNGSERWGVLDGMLASGEAVSMHESVVPAGTAKTAAHTIKHSELIFVVEGTLGFQHDGVEDKAAAGSVIYVAYGTEHLVWNAGETTARYMVWQMGGDTKKN